MPAGVESMFSAKETPWHKIGNVTEGALTSSEAIEKAGLDWTVSIRGLATFQEDNNTFSQNWFCLNHQLYRII